MLETDFLSREKRVSAWNTTGNSNCYQTPGERKISCVFIFHSWPEIQRKGVAKMQWLLVTLHMKGIFRGILNKDLDHTELLSSEFFCAHSVLYVGHGYKLHPDCSEHIIRLYASCPPLATICLVFKASCTFPQIGKFQLLCSLKIWFGVTGAAAHLNNSKMQLVMTILGFFQECLGGSHWKHVKLYNSWFSSGPPVKRYCFWRGLFEETTV